MCHYHCQTRQLVGQTRQGRPANFPTFPQFPWNCRNISFPIRLCLTKVVQQGTLFFCTKFCDHDFLPAHQAEGSVGPYFLFPNIWNSVLYVAVVICFFSISGETCSKMERDGTFRSGAPKFQKPTENIRDPHKARHSVVVGLCACGTLRPIKVWWQDAKEITELRTENQ